MTRPLRIEIPGALYHVTSRGDRQERIFADDMDRRIWLMILGETCLRYRFVVHAYCQMTNHYHLVVETPLANLSRGMRHLNGAYSQHFNRRHELVGHLFQGRYNAILCQRESYLMELARYVVLNPVRAGMVATPNAWPWSSHQALIGEAATPPWLDARLILSQFGRNAEQAVQSYLRFVQEGVGKESPLKKVRKQILLGNAEFTGEPIFLRPPEQLEEHSHLQRQTVALPLQHYFTAYENRDEAMTQAYLSLAYTMADIARYCGVSVRTVSRALQKHEVKRRRGV